MILFYDCFAGISGDMNLAALIDLGVPADYLKVELKKLPNLNYNLRITTDQRRGVTGTRVDVIIEEAPRSVLVQHNHTHEHRSFADIKILIEKSTLSEYIKQKSIAIFQKLAEAEGKIHNVPIEKVHFHEVGAVDSIVDIVGAVICIDYLKPSKIISGAIELGSGMVKCQHGLFPVPAPATAEVLKGIPVKSGTVSFEATTPTGAAILAVMVDEFVTKHNYTFSKTAYGIGHKDSEVPNVLRVSLCEENTSVSNSDSAMVLECNIDDMNPEIYGYLIDKILEKGALDVFVTPIVMKKSRPANILTVLCKPDAVDVFSEFLLSETSTLGVRSYSVNRSILQREVIEMTTSLGVVKVKKSFNNKGVVKYKAEFDNCVEIAKNSNLPLISVIAIINKEIQGNI
jgi:uncharacterized protein (TIGR00299 family) protein